MFHEEIPKTHTHKQFSEEGENRPFFQVKQSLNNGSLVPHYHEGAS